MMKILIVDDDLVTGTMLHKILTKKGYAVTHVPNGDEALAAIQTEPYRIILTDWIMPEMDGPTLCRHIRAKNLPNYIYIILLTAKNTKDDAVAGLDAGADDYIVKPFNQHELLARIRAGRRLVELEDTTRETQQKLARAEKVGALGYLAAGIAHEINNPIGFIHSNLNSFTSYMRDIRSMLTVYRELTHAIDMSISQNKMHADLPTQIKKSIQMEREYEIDFLLQDIDSLIADCQEGGARIQAIVNEMRYFAHPEKQIFECCSIAKMVEKVVSAFLPKLPAGVVLENSTNHLPQFECNTLHVEQVFANIIQNALDAVGHEGVIAISGNSSDSYIEIIVHDTGHGISEEHLPMIFDPFFTTKDVGQGVGLGLTTALNIIKMHSGTISCESHPGKGTTFCIRLPLGGSMI